MVAVLGLLPLSNGAQKYSLSNEFMNSSMGVEATVVDHLQVDVQKRSKKSPLYYDVVQFEDANGIVKKSVTNVGSYPIAHDVGDTVAVRFSLDNVDDVRIDSITGIWLESLFFLVPGVLLVFGGGLLFSTGQRRNRKARADHSK